VSAKSGKDVAVSSRDKKPEIFGLSHQPLGVVPKLVRYCLDAVPLSKQRSKVKLDYMAVEELNRFVRVSAPHRWLPLALLPQACSPRRY
jgi:hypothetical protein